MRLREDTEPQTEDKNVGCTAHTIIWTQENVPCATYSRAPPECLYLMTVFITPLPKIIIIHECVHLTFKEWFQHGFQFYDTSQWENSSNRLVFIEIHQS